MTTTPEPSQIDTTPPTPIPSLFATETQLFGWQGLSATMPAHWNLSSFSGASTKGQLRIDDEEGPRLELRWETPKGNVDLDKSIEKFLQGMEREAKKRRTDFKVAQNPQIVDNKRKRKQKLVNFGWTGDKEEAVAHGWGVAWQCGDCGRVVVAHLMGRGTERSGKVQRLAGEVLSSLECHGNGGWQTWSLFNCRIEIPEEFGLDRAKLMTGRIDMEWVRARKPGIFSSLGRDERITLSRWSLASVLLQRQTLQEWAENNLKRGDKHWSYSDWEETTVGEVPALTSEGVLRDLRLRLRGRLIDLVLRRPTRGARMLVWHNETDNKIMAYSTDLKAANEHVHTDVLDSLDCH
jgi:hypothetical protein